MSVEWFCQIMGSEVGPLNQRQFVDMVRQHRLNPEDLVRRNNSPWVPAFEVKGLFEAAAKPAAPDPEPPEEASSQGEETVGTRVIDRLKQTPPAPQSAVDQQQKVDARREIGARQAFESSEGQESAVDWFCIASGEKCGPLGFEELKALAREGSLRGRDRVWRASWPKFQKASEIEGLEIG